MGCVQVTHRGFAEVQSVDEFILSLSLEDQCQLMLEENEKKTHKLLLQRFALYSYDDELCSVVYDFFASRMDPVKHTWSEVNHCLRVIKQIYIYGHSRCATRIRNDLTVRFQILHVRAEKQKQKQAKDLLVELKELMLDISVSQNKRNKALQEIRNKVPKNIPYQVSVGGGNDHVNGDYVFLDLVHSRPIYYSHSTQLFLRWFEGSWYFCNDCFNTLDTTPISIYAGAETTQKVFALLPFDLPHPAQTGWKILESGEFVDCTLTVVSSNSV